MNGTLTNYISPSQLSAPLSDISRMREAANQIITQLNETLRQAASAYGARGSRGAAALRQAAMTGGFSPFEAVSASENLWNEALRNYYQMVPGLQSQAYSTAAPLYGQIAQLGANIPATQAQTALTLSQLPTYWEQKAKEEQARQAYLDAVFGRTRQAEQARQAEMRQTAQAQAETGQARLGEMKQAAQARTAAAWERVQQRPELTTVQVGGPGPMQYTMRVGGGYSGPTPGAQAAYAAPASYYTPTSAAAAPEPYGGTMSQAAYLQSIPTYRDVTGQPSAATLPSTPQGVPSIGLEELFNFLGV